MKTPLLYEFVNTRKRFDADGRPTRVYSAFRDSKRKMSGISGSFRAPTLVRKLKKSHGLPSLDWNLLRNEKEIASGSFGTVYLAKYGHGERKVIVKKLKGESVECIALFALFPLV